MDLSPIQKQEQRELREAYGQFWTNNTAFKRGWAKPLINLDDVNELLDEVSGYVILLRGKIDEKNGKRPIRSPKTGAAIEYLWTLEYNPVNEKDRFVRELVLATFSDSNGYLEGLTEEEIVKHIKECKDLKRNIHENLKNKLQEQFQIFDGKVKQVLSQSHVILPEEATHIQKVIHGISSLCKHLDTHLEQKKPKTEEKPQEEIKQRGEDYAATKERYRKQAEAIQSEMESARKEQDRILEEKNQGVLKIQQIAHDVEHLKSDIEHLSSDTKTLDITGLKSNPTEGMKTIEQLEKKCLNYTEELLKDLASLDQVIGTEDTRPLRKKQVHSVQDLMKEIDQVNEKLHILLYQMKQEQKTKEEEHLIQQSKGPDTTPQETNGEPKKVKTVIGMTPDGRAIVVEMTPDEQKQLEKMIEEEMAEIQKHQLEQEEGVEESGEKKEEDQESPKRRKLDQPESLTPLQTETVENSKSWRDLKLSLKFETEDHPLFYVLTSYVPGVKQEDLSIQLSKNTKMLTVKGNRVPTPEEEEAMKRQVKHMHKLDPKGIYFPADEDERKSVMRLGAGRYGTFQQSFQLPEGVVVEKMAATYNGGVLQILVPKNNTEIPTLKPKKVPYGVYSAPMPIYNDNQMWWQ